MHRFTIHKSRPLLYFLFGIGLPGIIIGVLAIRGIRNDQALIEKESREKYRLYAAEIVNVLEAELSRVQNQVQHAVSGVARPRTAHVFPVLLSLREEIPWFITAGDETTFWWV